jgi:hypothetical protein
MNSRLKFSSNKLECGFGVNLEEQMATVNKMIQVVEEMRRVGKKTANLPFQKGIVTSSRSLLTLYNELSSRHGVEFILTSHLNQDALENFFSRIRALGGSNTHPTSVDFLYRMKNLIIGKAAHLVVERAAVKVEEEINPTEPCFLSQIATKSFEVKKV